MVKTPKRYVPAQGDVVWIRFQPQAGHEQSGHRPALVLSPSDYNRRVGLAVMCPVTNQVKGYPFEVRIPPGLPVTGVVLADQVKSLDWRARRATFHCSVPGSVVSETLRKLALLLTIIP